MIKSKLLAVLLLICNVYVFAQSIQFVSTEDAKPLFNVIVFNEAGDVLATSDIEGKIEKEELKPFQNQYKLVYEGVEIGKLTSNDLEKNTIALRSKVKEIEEVVIKFNKKAKYIFVRGNFNVYLLINKKLNVYADGVVTYVFDRKTKKLKSTRLEQYRSFQKKYENVDKKDASSMVYYSFLETPDPESAGRLDEIRAKRPEKYKEVDLGEQFKFQYNVEKLQDKSFKFFGYEFFDFKYLNSIVFNNQSTNLRDFSSFNEIMNFKLRHKTEPDFHQFTQHSTFIPTSITFGDNIDIPKLKLKPNRSFYSYEFWKMNGFPNMQPTFSSFFKDGLKEQPNEKGNEY